MGTRERFPIPLALGATVGAGAWIAGYLLTYLFATHEIRNNVGLQVFQFVSETDDPTLVGWVFFNAHSVTVGFLGAPAALGEHDFIAVAGGRLEFLYLLPPVALLTAGAFVTWRRREHLRNATDALLSGATVVVGYLPLSIIGAAAFSVEIGGETIRPDPTAAVIFAGIVYPVVLGAIGGLLVALAAARPTSASTSA